MDIMKTSWEISCLPNTRAIATGSLDHQPYDCSGRCDGESKRHDSAAGANGIEVLCHFKIDWHIVKEGPDDQALDHGPKVSDDCSRGIEEAAAYEREVRSVGRV